MLLGFAITMLSCVDAFGLLYLWRAGVLLGVCCVCGTFVNVYVVLI